MKDGGYLMIDHRASPGLPEDIALQNGLDPKQVGEGKIFEAATLTCSHCKCTVVKNPLRVRERAKCSKCGWHYICDICAVAMLHPDYVHTPFEAIATGAKPAPLGSPMRLLLPDEPA
jgi:hypothetical protein